MLSKLYFCFFFYFFEINGILLHYICNTHKTQRHTKNTKHLFISRKTMDKHLCVSQHSHHICIESCFLLSHIYEPRYNLRVLTIYFVFFCCCCNKVRIINYVLGLTCKKGWKKEKKIRVSQKCCKCDLMINYDISIQQKQDMTKINKIKEIL